MITGFLGAGKTTFLKQYAKYLISKGEKICIIENDFGAINVDMVLLKELEGPLCNLEMVVGGDGAEAHKRRLKTKLISMAMLGYKRVIIEPSGIYDVDEFFDLLYEDPIDNWYEAGNVIAILNPKQEDSLTASSRYMLMSEAAQAGVVVLSRTDQCSVEEKERAIERLNDAMAEFGCSRRITQNEVLDSSGKNLDESDYDKVIKCGYNRCDHVKMSLSDTNQYQTYFYFDFQMEIDKIVELTGQIFQDKKCGGVHRIKGVIQTNTGDFYEINTTRNEIMTNKVNAIRAVLIVIGENMNREKLSGYLGEPTV